MNTLATAELTQYLNKVRELELSCYKQNCYMDVIREKIQEVQHPALYDYVAKLPPRNIKAVTTVDFLGYLYKSIYIGAFLWFVAAIVLKMDIIRADDFGFSVAWFLFFPIATLAAFIVSAIQKKHKQQEIREAKNEEIEKNNAKIRTLNQDIRSKCQQQEQLLQTELQHAQATYAKTSELLQQYYSKDIVYGKYRSMVPITMFCEYLLSGRCSELVGHEGAYNIYESEILMNAIITKLSDIISQLEKIQENQHMLAHMISAVTNELGLLRNSIDQNTSSLSRIENNQVTANYYQQIQAENSENIKWMVYMDSIHHW
jgi:hypothetical protein